MHRNQKSLAKTMPKKIVMDTHTEQINAVPFKTNPRTGIKYSGQLAIDQWLTVPKLQTEARNIIKQAKGDSFSCRAFLKKGRDEIVIAAPRIISDPLACCVKDHRIRPINERTRHSFSPLVMPEIAEWGSFRRRTAATLPEPSVQTKTWVTDRVTVKPGEAIIVPRITASIVKTVIQKEIRGVTVPRRTAAWYVQ
jgi:hypothetical protein